MAGVSAAQDHTLALDEAKLHIVQAKSSEDKNKDSRVSETVGEVIYDPDFPDDVYPTDEELATLPRHPDTIPLNVYLVRFCVGRSTAKSDRIPFFPFQRSLWSNFASAYRE